MSLRSGAIAAAVLLAGAVGLFAAMSTPRQAHAAPATQPADIAENLPDWRIAFNNAYALLPDQNLKYVPPPPLAERQQYLLEVGHNKTPMPFIQWRWVNGTLKREWMAGGGPRGASLSYVVMACTRLDAHQVSIEGLPPINADGDWIVRDGASTEDVLASLRVILHEQFQTDMNFEKEDVTKDALVISGTYHLQRIADATIGDLQVYADVLDHPKAGESIMGGGNTSAAEFWSILGGYLGSPMVDQTKEEPRKIDWLLSWSIRNAGTDATRRQQILDNITTQTGLTFKQDKHVFTTWKLTAALKQ
jgi:uncharacterized protein (TIGR03435 family)